MKHRTRDLRPQTGSPDSEAALISEVARLADAGHPERSLHLLAAANLSTDATRNARGACQLRLNRIEDAVRTLRTLVLPANCTWMKPELPVVYRTNFITALLLAQQPAGGKELMEQMSEQNHPSVIRLRETLECWEHGLSWWQWFNWKTGLIPNVPIPLNFIPGEFFELNVPLSKSSPQIVMDDGTKSQAV